MQLRDDINRTQQYLQRFNERDHRDEMNPRFALQGMHKDILIAAARGDIDLNALARIELANRGLGMSGHWVGFKEAGNDWLRVHDAQAVAS